MSNSPEKNESGYSVFDNPEHFEEKSEKEKVSRHPMRNRLIAALIIAAVIAGGTFAAVKLIPKPVEQTEEKTEISVLNLSEAADSIKLTNEITALEFVSNVTETNGESQTLWSIEGVKPEYTNSETIASFVNSLTTLTALQKLPAEANADYGFEKATITAEIKTKSKTVTLTFGDKAPAEIGVYCKSSENPNEIFVVSLVSATALQVIPTDFANATGFSGVEITSANTDCFTDDGTVSDFDYINLTSKNFDKPLKMVMQNDDSLNSYFAFKIISPIERIGDNDNSQAVLNLFGKGFSAEGAYAFEPNDATLEKYHLKNPDYVCSVGIAGEDYTLKFGAVDETYCAYLSQDGKMIEKVAISSIPFIKSKITDYYSSFLVLENLSGLKGLRVDSADKTYNFDLKYTKGKETADDKYQAFFGGKELDITSFKNYYQALIGISPIAYDTGAKGNAQIKITFVHSSDIKDTVLSFKPYSAQRYQVDINGLPLGLITKNTLDTFLKNTEKIASGEKM